MAFGEKSTNPRERRAYAHAKLARIKEAGCVGTPTISHTLDEALRAVVAAAHTPKGKASGFAGRLAKEAVVVGDLSSDQPEAVKLWRPHHTWSDRTKRLDAYYTDGVTQEVLDITGTSDECCVTPDQASEAKELWQEGQVLHTNRDREDDRPALVLSQPAVSDTVIAEALSRHFQTAVTSPAQIVQ